MFHVTRRKAALGAALAASALLGSVGHQVFAAEPATGRSEASTVAPAEPTLIPDEPFWSYPLCEVEDASSGPVPCLWPADRVGNGIGNTFYVEPGPNGSRCFHYVNPTQRKWDGCDE